MLNKSTLALAVLLALAGCDKAQTPTQSTETPVAAVAEVKTLTSGVELSNMDTSVKPQQLQVGTTRSLSNRTFSVM